MVTKISAGQALSSGQKTAAAADTQQKAGSSARSESSNSLVNNVKLVYFFEFELLSQRNFTLSQQIGRLSDRLTDFEKKMLERVAKIDKRLAILEVRFDHLQVFQLLS